MCTEDRSRRSRQESAEKEEVSARRHLDQGSQAQEHRLKKELREFGGVEPEIRFEL